jgi:hypothetical protein
MTTNVGEDARKKRALIHCLWECKVVQPLSKTVWRLLRKLKIELPCDPKTSLLAIYLNEYESGYNKGTCTPMFIVAFFTKTKL